MHVRIALGLILVCASPGFARDETRPAQPNPMASADAVITRRLDQVIQFIKGGDLLKEQAALLETSKDEGVKALFKPFLGRSLWSLDPRGGPFFAFKKSNSSSDQIPKPISYTALQNLGVLRGTDDAFELWFKVATNRKNDRGTYPALRTEAERKQYFERYQVFVVLAEFWHTDESLAP
jgi:hypothetical protein